MKSKLKFVLLILITFKGNESNGLRCYVCSDDSELPCINFDSDKDKFIQQCSNSQKGCFFKVEGDKKTRSCDDKKIDDCKTANDVKYCFCSIDLCNGSSGKFRDITDDEDLIEGSGTKMVFDVKEKEIENKPKQNVTVTYIHAHGSKLKTSQYFAFLTSILIVLY